MEPLLRDRRKRLRDTLAGIKEAFRLVVVGGVVTVRLDVSPEAGRKSFWKNARILGFRRQRRGRRQRRPPYKGLFFLALLVTTSGVNPAVARQLDYLMSYLVDGKPHGFLNQLKSATRLCLSLS
jgi:hypothetical protein